MIGSKKQMTAGFSAPGMLPIKNRRKPPMTEPCHISGCKHDVPAALHPTQAGANLITGPAQCRIVS